VSDEIGAVGFWCAFLWAREIVVFISVVFCFSGSLGTCFQWRYREKGIWSCW
jgi:hypothetical protein